MEAEIYRRLGPHDRLVPMLGYSEEGLVLEYMENGTLKDCLREHHNVTMDQRLRWAEEAAEGASATTLTRDNPLRYQAAQFRSLSAYVLHHRNLDACPPPGPRDPAPLLLLPSSPC
jgi:hypothetical protein